MDLPVIPDFPVVEKKSYNTIISNFENGVEQRRSKRSVPIREFELTFKNRDQADYDALSDFYDTKLGAFGTFTFDNPNDGVTYTVRFKEDSLRSSLVHYQIFSMQAILIEVI